MARDITFDIVAKDRASSTFRNVGKAAGDGGGSLARFAGVAKKAIGALALYEVGRKAAEGIKSVVEAAAEDQQSQALLAKQYRNSAKATDAQIESTEKWITTAGRAKGVTDDELRPALGNLITATHNVRKAQGLANLAMDVSAAKGLPLATVSKALARAYNGNVGALGRLGIATKDAQGKTLTFSGIQKQLTTQFGGAAATKADTFAGKMQRLKVVFQEAKESLGAKLLPALTSVASWFLSSGLPAIQKFSAALSDKLAPAFSAIGGFFAKVVPWFQQFTSESGKGSGVLSQFAATAKLWGSTIGSIFASVQSIATAFWARFGGLITTYAVGTIKNLLKELQGAFNIIGGLFKLLADVMHGNWSAAWADVKQILHGAVQIIEGSVSQLWNQLKTEFTIGVKLLGSAIKALPGLILSIDGAMLRAGASLMRSLFDGILQGAKNAGGFISGLSSSLITAVRKAINSALHLPLKVSFNKGPIHLNGTVIPALAKGGIVKARAGGTLALLGEAGQDEMVTPLPRRNGASHATAAVSAGTTNITFNLYGVFDGNDAAEKIRKVLVEYKNTLGGRALGLA